MSVRREPWPEGAPAWVDLMVPDRHEARDFYGPLFGWQFDEGPPETGFYTNCLKDGEPVAGIGELLPGQLAMPSVWTTYLAVDDVHASAAKAIEAGGRLLVEPMQVMGFGRMAVVADPTGAVFGVWQAGTHAGFTRVDEPGSVTWNEVMTRDYAAAQDFYRTVFGYDYEDMSGDGYTYATLQLNGRMVGGIGEVGVDWPADVSPYWMTYFKVEDADASVAQVTRLGGEVVREAWDSPFGRIAIVTGPVGETFALLGRVLEPAHADQA